MRNGRAADYLERVGRAIVGQTELGDREWTFHLVDDPAVNAFNIPGGHVYVNTGLVEAAPDAAAFAGVLAHEIAHGVARHGTEQLTKVYGINILGGVLLGQNPAVYEQILAQVLAGGAIARFSRADENEADELGVRYSYEAGYDPMGLPRMLEVIAREAQRDPGKIEQFFATHPMTEDRIEATRQMASCLEGGRRNEPGVRGLPAHRFARQLISDLRLPVRPRDCPRAIRGSPSPGQLGSWPHGHGRPAPRRRHRRARSGAAVARR